MARSAISGARSYFTRRPTLIRILATLVPSSPSGTCWTSLARGVRSIGMSSCITDAASCRGHLRTRRSNDLVLQRVLAAPETAKILQQQIDDVVFVATRFARGVRRDQRVLTRPQRRIRRQWL